MNTKRRAAKTAPLRRRHRKGGKLFLVTRAMAHEEFAEALQQAAEALCIVDELARRAQQPRVDDALRLLDAMAQDTASMARKFHRRATTVKGRPPKNEILTRFSAIELRWLGAEYVTFAEELVWLVGRSRQRLDGQLSIDWQSLPRPVYRNALSLADVWVVQSATLQAERVHATPTWAPGVELSTLQTTLIRLIDAHRAIASFCHARAEQIGPGAPQKDGPPEDRVAPEKPKPLTGRALVIRVHAEFTRDGLPPADASRKDRRAKWRAALTAVARSIVEATGHLQGGAFRGTTFEAAVKDEMRRMQREISRWRLTVPTHVKQRPPPPRRSLSTTAAGSHLDRLATVWRQADAPDADQGGGDKGGDV